MKTTILNSLKLGLWLSAAFSAFSAPSGMVGWWSGDGTARDFVGSNNGVLRHGATFATGKVGQAFALDGIRQYVTIPHSAVLNPSGAFSVEVWIRANPVQFSTDGQFLIVDKSHGWAPPATGWLLQGNPDGTVAFGFGDGGYDAGPPGYPTVSTLSSVLDDTWHHLAGVFTGAQLQIYLDGKLQNTAALSISPTGNNREMEIGRSWGGPYGTTRYFRGLIDEVILYNRAINAEEVARNFNAGSAAKPEIATIVKQPAGTGSTGVAAARNSATGSPATVAVKPAGASIALYAGVTVEGVLGQTYGIQYSADLNDPNGWRGAANITLAAPAELWFDVEAANQPQRYYRVVSGPISIP